ncbi:DUF4149 domain-containing protein [Halocalculus aciditolerans]|uniref:TMEM205-like domain-containing protein n=1 Tax=Halocalculus aciditolerans TaxID=1383812 RepID=A0A830F427_9EURY|nr:DUF4149 domain-containing protein [Halocalculus aciditolerans]GGL60609.1 hypothetical protein GCM10009039_18590 [Halocalculus aciditolerans]
MSLATALAGFVVDASLGSWLGAMAFFSFVAAPTTFRVLDDDAGRVVNAIFPTYYVVGVALGALAVVAWAALGALSAAPSLGVPAMALVGVLCHAYARWALVPKMEAAGDDAFATYHKQSVGLNGVAILAVTLALLAAQF